MLGRCLVIGKPGDIDHEVTRGLAIGGMTEEVKPRHELLKG
jgi:hypothetical protein